MTDIYYNAQAMTEAAARAEMSREGFDVVIQDVVVAFAERVEMAANEKTPNAVQGKGKKRKDGTREPGGWYVPAGQGKGRGKNEDPAEAAQVVSPTTALLGNDAAYQLGKNKADILLGKDANDYNRALHGISEVLSGQGRSVSAMDLAGRWHDPLASASSSHSLSDVTRAMLGKAQPIASDQSDVRSYEPYGVQQLRRPFLQDGAPVSRIERMREDMNKPGGDFDVARKYAGRLEAQAGDLLTLAPESPVGGDLLRKASEIRSTVENRDLHLLNLSRQKRFEERQEEQRQEDAKKFDPDVSSIPVRGMAKNVLANNLQKASGRYDFLKTAQTTGVATDGRFLFRLKPKEKMYIDRLQSTSEARELPQRTIEESLHPKVDDAPSAIVGVRQRDEYVQYLIRNNTGKARVVNAKAARTIMDRYPNATIHMNSRNAESPLVFREEGKNVAVLMPLHNDELEHKLKGE